MSTNTHMSYNLFKRISKRTPMSKKITKIFKGSTRLKVISYILILLFVVTMTIESSAINVSYVRGTNNLHSDKYISYMSCISKCQHDVISKIDSYSPIYQSSFIKRILSTNSYQSHLLKRFYVKYHRLFKSNQSYQSHSDYVKQRISTNVFHIENKNISFTISPEEIISSKQLKRHRLHSKYELEFEDGNALYKTNVPKLPYVINQSSNKSFRQYQTTRRSVINRNRKMVSFNKVANKFNNPNIFGGSVNPTCSLQCLLKLHREMFRTSQSSLGPTTYHSKASTDVKRHNAYLGDEPEDYARQEHDIKKRDSEYLAEDNVTMLITYDDASTVNLTSLNPEAEMNATITEVAEVTDATRRKVEEGVIYIHGLFEQSGGECRDFPGTGPYEFEAAQLAIQHVNERSLIPGYELRMYHNDTKCDSGVAVDAFFHSLYRQPTMMFVLGTGSSEVTERLARVVSRWNVIQVSYGASSPALSDRKNFPKFYRTVAPDSSHNAALLAFILHHRWNTVTVLHEQGDKHALPMTKLVTDLEQVNVTVTLTKGVSVRDFKEHLQEMKDHDCRIIICSFSPTLLRKIFCQVFQLGMYGAEYAWILVGDAPQLWLDGAPLSDRDCDDQQLSSATQGLISAGSHYGVVGNMTTVSSLSTDDLLTHIRIGNGSSGFVTHTYDAIWAIALAMRQARRDWLQADDDVTLDQFSYDDHQMARNISDILGKLHFTGVSGPVSFHNSDRVGITAFHQKQDNVLQLVAFYYPEVAELDFQCPGCNDVIWQGGSPPIASRIIIQRIAILDRSAFLCVTALAVFGVSLALTFLSFNLYYRKFKFIKLSSPNLNNFVIVGCVSVYVAVILLGIDHGTLASDDHFPVICSARAFLLSGGFSLAFGCMFIKTYRVYHIFIRANTGIVKSKLLHDQQLLGLVSVLLLIDCVIVTLWVTIDPMERQLTNLSMQVHQEERNVVYLYMKEHCSSVHMAKWLGGLYIYKGLLLVGGCYMAWETRHVKVPALNDSQYIGMSVYNVVITSVIVVALANVIPAERYTLTFVLVSSMIFVSTTTTLCILFVPKIHTILINPEDNAIVATPGVKVECKTRRFALDEPRESLYRAEVLNRALKRELLELEEEYNRLAQKVGFTPCEVRKPKLSDNQDDDSDDGLPPWLSEYKEYSCTGSKEDDVWYTGKGAAAAASTPSVMASAFSAIHKVALRAAELPSTSGEQAATSRAGEPVDTSKRAARDTGCSAALRASLPTVASLVARRRQHQAKPVRSFLSDRALNKLKIPQTLRETVWDDADGSPSLPLRNGSHPHHSALYDHLRSEPKLYCPNRRTSNGHLASARSLNQMLTMVSGSRLSGMSRNTVSCDSDWMTAPLYTSTSFSTPPDEDFMSMSTNNGNSRRVSSEDDANYLSCEGGGSNGDEQHESHRFRLDDEFRKYDQFRDDDRYRHDDEFNKDDQFRDDDRFRDSDTYRDGEKNDPGVLTDCLLGDSPVEETATIKNPSTCSSPDHSTYCEVSTGTENSNAMSASNSNLSEATVSELSVDKNNGTNRNVNEATVSELSIDKNNGANRNVNEATVSELSVDKNNGTNRNVNVNEDPIICNNDKISGRSLEILKTVASCSVSPDIICDAIAASKDNHSVTSDCSSSMGEDISPTSNNNLVPVADRDTQMDTLRNRIFRLERELILMHLDQSEAVDL